MSAAEAVLILAMWAMQGGIAIPELEAPPAQEQGLASWYGSEDGTNDNGMHGSITANGDLFIPSNQTCASRSIPLGTLVLVEVVETGKRAWCEVTDRGPYGFRLTAEGGEWAAVWQRRGQWVVRRRDGGWLPEETRDRRPRGYYRGVMDLSRGTAEALDFDFRAGLNEIKVRYHANDDLNRFNLHALQ